MYREGWIKTGMLLLIALLFTSTASATFNDKDLGEIVQSALREGGQLTHYEMTQIKDFKSIAGVTSPKTNVRVVKVVGYYNVGSKRIVKTLTVPVAIANTGSQIVAAAKLVDVEEGLFEDVLQKKYNRKAFEVFRKKYKGVDFQLKNVKGMVEFHGAYPIEGENKKNATKAVAGMLQFARGMIHNLVTAREDVAENRFENLSDRKINGPISARDFESLVEDKSLRDYHEDKGDYNTWSFGKDELSLWFDMENHADKLIVYISRDISGLDGGEKEKQLRKLIKFVGDKPFDAASKTEALYYDDGKDWLSAKMTFLYNGTIKGKKLSKAYWDLWKDYSKKIASALE